MFSSVAAHKQLTTQKQKPNHNKISLKDYSDLKGSPFLCGFTTVAWEIYFVVHVPHCVLHQNGKLICEAENNEKTTYFRLPKVVFHGEINKVF